MQLIRNLSLDPAFNLAAEEFFLTGTRGDVVLLWRNDKAVIIGRNQNAYAELNLPFVEQNRVTVIRRMTGGGAVFHDPGNVNFSFFSDSEIGKDGIDFQRFLDPILGFLKELGLDAALSGRNDIMVGDRKISGNAQCIKNGRVLHHGTLLFDSDLSELAASLRPDAQKLESKGVKSIRSRVGNIVDFLSKKIDVVAFLSALENYIGSRNGLSFRDMTEEERRETEKLKKEKYATWEWNFGESRSFDLTRTARFPFGRVTVSLSSEEGRIRDIAFSGDFFSAGEIDQTEKALIGCRLERNDLLSALCGVEKTIAGSTREDILGLIL